VSDWVDLNENQLRQMVDSQSLWAAWRQASKAAQQVRGSMFWREMRGVKYLIRTTAAGAQTTIGRDTPEDREIYARFIERKARNQEMLRGLKLRMAEQRRLNRAYRVGRTPGVIVKVLQALEAAGIAEHFTTIGTNAIYAYESAAGVRVSPGATATLDLDLLFDARRRLAFLTTMQRMDTSLIGVLRKADPSFTLRDDQLQTAFNKDGFEVDIIRRAATSKDPHPMRMTDGEEDLWAVQIPDGERLAAGHRFESLVVSAAGEMALMRALHPLAFIRVKQQLAASPSRPKLKADKDALQARVVQALWDEHLSLLERGAQA